MCGLSWVVRLILSRTFFSCRHFTPAWFTVNMGTFVPHFLSAASPCPENRWCNLISRNLFFRHWRHILAVQRVPILEREQRNARAQHDLFLPQLGTLRALLRRKRDALLAISQCVGRHDIASGAEPLSRHVPYGCSHAHRRCDDPAARAVRLRRSRVRLYPLGILVGRCCSVRAVLLGYHIRDVSCK